MLEGWWDWEDGRNSRIAGIAGWQYWKEGRPRRMAGPGGWQWQEHGRGRRMPAEDRRMMAVAVTWDGNGEGLVPCGCSGMPSWGHPAVGGDVPRLLCGHGETHGGGSSPLAALLLCPAASPWEDPSHQISTHFFFGICRNLQTLDSQGSTEQPHTEHLPFPDTTSCPRAWHSPFSAPTAAPWLSPAPTWIPITLSDPGPQCWGHWPRVPPSSAPSHRAELFCLHTTLPPCLPPFPPFPLLAKHTGKGRDFNLLPGTN